MKNVSLLTLKRKCLSARAMIQRSKPSPSMRCFEGFREDVVSHPMSVYVFVFSMCIYIFARPTFLCPVLGKRHVGQVLERKDLKSNYIVAC